MKTLLIALSLVVSIAAASAKENFQLIPWKNLAGWMHEKNAKVAIFDANNEATRKADGIIPGATLLPSHKDYPLAVLPVDKSEKVVFYCANTKCMASHTAAQRASDAGYSHVYVMSDGIQGW